MEGGVGGGAQKYYIAFRIAVTLDVKIVWFGRKVAVCVNKRHTN